MTEATNVVMVRPARLLMCLLSDSMMTLSTPVPLRMPPMPSEPTMMATSSYMLVKPPRLRSEEMRALSQVTEKPLFMKPATKMPTTLPQRILISAE